MMDESGCSPGASDVASLEVWMDDGSSSPLLLRLLPANSNQNISVLYPYRQTTSSTSVEMRGQGTRSEVHARTSAD